MAIRFSFSSGTLRKKRILTPHDHMRCLGLQAYKVPKVVMGSLCLGDLIMWFWLDSMNEVRELDGVLNKENRNVVADDIPVPFLCVHLESKSSHVTDSVLQSIM